MKDYVWNLLKREPAMALGLVVALGVAVQTAVASGSILSWRDLVPVVTAAAIRFFVTPANEVVIQKVDKK